MKFNELWRMYEADNRLQGNCFNLFKAYVLHLKLLVDELRDLEFGDVSLQLLKEYLAKQIIANLLGHCSRFVRYLFRLFRQRFGRYIRLATKIHQILEGTKRTTR
ncbi:hypothetical protein EMIT07CA2_10006 [Brevibacillus sp. IT-7CA2]|uniref:integrase n=1 Tax=Brevibacillus sp. IT-7CA2 TaxID=3026436 RepID=UPI0039E0FCFE